MSNYFKAGPAGGGGGDIFDDGILEDGLELAGLIIRSGNWIDAIQPLYRPRGSSQRAIPGNYHGGTGGEVNQFTLAPSEYVIQIAGNWGNYIDEIFIATNLNNQYHFGKGRGIAPYTFQVPDMGWEIVSFFGRSHTFVDALGVYIRQRA